MADTLLADLAKQLDEIRAKMRDQRRGQADPVEDYDFQTPDGGVKLSALFDGKADLLFVHNMGRGCPYCTLWADGFNGLVDHLNNRAAFVLGSPDPPEVQQAFSRARGWRFRMVSYGGGPFPRDMGYESDEPNQYGRFMPGVSAFHRHADGSMVRTGNTYFGPFDEFCSLWPMIDLLKDGVNEWQPKYEYE